VHAERVLLVEPRGFCAGVEMAIKALALMVLRCGPPVYCVHDIVHNDRVVARFRRLGVRFVDRVEQLPPGIPVLLSAHGTAPGALATAVARASVLIDSACPLVTKVHHELAARARDGFDIVYVGQDGHDESTGALGVAPARTRLVTAVADVDDLPRTGRPVAVLAQTTLAVDEWTAVVGAARRRFGSVWTARRDDICYATSNRQAALHDVAGAVDAVIVVGSASSANTAALVRVARRAGAARVLRVDGSRELSGVGAVPTVAVTAGASAPEDAVREVVRALSPVIVERVAPIHERTHFPLPAALRRLLADDVDGAALLALERELSAAELLARVEATMTARAA
jgi:4-hydroxy-3-methylbut-2-en-1-yl diphosphate reductase